MSLFGGTRFYRTIILLGVLVFCVWQNNASAQRVLQCTPGTATVRNNLTLGIPGDSLNLGNLRVSGDAYIDGRVGVGTTSPIAGTKMTIESAAANAMISFTRSGTEIGLIGANTANQINIQGNNQPIRFSTDGFTTEHMRIATGGNVGIGTANPLRTFVVNGIIEGTQGRFGELTNAAGNFRQLTSYFDNAYGPDGAGVLQAVHIGVGYNPIILNPLGGNIGIGTTNPTAQLHVNASGGGEVLQLQRGNGTPFVRFMSDGGAPGAKTWVLQANSPASGFFRIRNETDNIDPIVVTSAGSVGIGTTTPDAAARLDISGQIKITGGTPGAGRVLTSDAAGLASWQAATGGLPPATTAGQTLRADGTSWVANSTLFNTGVNVGVGTINPTIRLAVGDTDTGLDWVSDGILTVKTNAAERIRIDTAGGVGIGTAGIGANLKLQVGGANGRIAPNFGTTTDATYRFGSGGENTGFSSPTVDLVSLISAGQEKAVLNTTGLLINSVLKTDLAAPTTYRTGTKRYIVEATPAQVGVVIPLDNAMMAELCRDKDGCEFTIAMVNWDAARPGLVVSRNARFYMSETSNWWGQSQNDPADRQGNDNNAGINEWGTWDCYFGDAETSTNTNNGRSDSGIGFGLLNVRGGSYSDTITTCRAIVED